MSAHGAGYRVGVGDANRTRRHTTVDVPVMATASASSVVVIGREPLAWTLGYLGAELTPNEKRTSPPRRRAITRARSTQAHDLCFWNGRIGP